MWKGNSSFIFICKEARTSLQTGSSSFKILKGITVEISHIEKLEKWQYYSMTHDSYNDDIIDCMTFEGNNRIFHFSIAY